MSGKVVKSVGRVFSIIELYDQERRAMSASEVSRALETPHSSTVAILKSMQELGYLTADPGHRTYLPSIKLTQVVEWIATDLHEETAILAVMEDLHNEVDETINLSRQTGDFVKIVHGLESTKLLGIRVRKGVVMPLTASHTGMVALATYPNEEVKQIVRDQQKRNYPEARSVSVEEALSEVREIRNQQLSPGYDVFIDGIGIIAFPLASQTGARPFVVAIAGPTERIRANEDEIVRAARRAINKHGARLAYPA
ncbi:MAG: helix-turn-helix domain-containing protein [Woeseiaceae bacterium]|nr:helix-turn-helix domain-containing protein [Woeseiaceae bacterium]